MGSLLPSGKAIAKKRPRTRSLLDTPERVVGAQAPPPNAGPRDGIMDPARVAPGPDDADPELEELSELNDEGLFDSHESDTECDHSWSSSKTHCL